MIKERMPVSKAPERKPERKREPAVAESGQNQPRKEPANIGELHALQASLENLLNWSISKKASQAEINERKKALERVNEEIQTLEDEIVNIENPGLRDKRTKVEPQMPGYFYGNEPELSRGYGHVEQQSGIGSVLPRRDERATGRVNPKLNLHDVEVKPLSIYLKSFSLPTLPNKTRTKAKTIICRLVFNVRSQFSKVFGISPTKRNFSRQPNALE